MQNKHNFSVIFVLPMRTFCGLKDEIFWPSPSNPTAGVGHSHSFLCPPVAASARGLGVRHESGTFWCEGSCSRFGTRMPVPWQHGAQGPGGSALRGAAPSETAGPAETHRQGWKCRERVSGVLRMYFPWGIGKGLVSPSMSSKQVSQLNLISATDTRQMLLYIFQ